MTDELAKRNRAGKQVAEGFGAAAYDATAGSSPSALHPIEYLRPAWVFAPRGLALELAALRAMPLVAIIGLKMTAEEDIATVAAQLAELTRTVAEMETQLRELRKRADTQQERADRQRDRTEVQQERIDLAARELAEVSARLQAAADALRESV